MAAAAERAGDAMSEPARAADSAHPADPADLRVQRAAPRWARRLLVLACLLLLLPFISKPLHIDDPMYVWAAEHILERPLDPYGFDVSWGFAVRPMSAVMKNPPLVSYYLAAVIAVFGTSEIALHAALLLPAIGVVLGTYELARELGSAPLLAAAATLVTPVFLLSATTVMSDVAMLCSYVWAVWFWMRGMRSGRADWLMVAAVLVAVAALTKYFGITLLPLLAAYGLARTRRLGTWILPLLIPVAVLAAYQVGTTQLYGRGLLFDAAGYATQQRWSGGPPLVATMLKALAFTGGCCAAMFVTAAAAAPLRALLLAMVGATAAVAAVAHDPVARELVGFPAGAAVLVQLALWAGAGAALLVMLARRLWSMGDAEAMLLALWIVGTFCFAVFVNWSVAGRSILPMAPPAAIVAASFFTTRGSASATAPGQFTRRRSKHRAWAGLVLVAILSLVVAVADDSYARSQRRAATELAALRARSTRLWFTGHWGFQHYIRHAAEPIDAERLNLAPGEIVIYPENNTAVVALPPGTVRKTDTREYRVFPLATTMLPGRSGFYSDVFGPLPFFIGPVPNERYHVGVVETAVRQPG